MYDLPYSSMCALVDLGGVPNTCPPTGPNASVFGYFFTKNCPCQRSMPPPNGCTNPYRKSWICHWCVCKQSHSRTTVLGMPAKCVTYWYLLLKGKSMPFRQSILYFVTVLAHLVHITCYHTLSVCIIISVDVITVIIGVIISVIVTIIVIVDTIYAQPPPLHVSTEKHPIWYK